MRSRRPQPDGWYVKVSSNINAANPSALDPTLGYAFFEGANTVTATEELPPSEIPPVSPLFGGPVTGGVVSKSAPAAQLLAIPQVAALNGSYLVAMNLNTGKRVWMNTHLTADVPRGDGWAGDADPDTGSFQGGMLTTASGLLVTGNGNSLSAFDSKTGALLWTSPALKARVVSPPSTYMVNGKQYIAVEVGSGGLLGGPFSGALPGARPRRCTSTACRDRANLSDHPLGDDRNGAAGKIRRPRSWVAGLSGRHVLRVRAGMFAAPRGSARRPGVCPHV